MPSEFPPHLLGPEMIGQGGHGSVYRVTWAGDPRVLPVGTIVAVKVFHKPDDRSIRRMAARRDFLLAGARHINLVSLFEITLPPDWPFAYVVMEYMSGGSLRAKLEDFRSPRAIVSLVKLLAMGCAHLHSSEVIHRDLKPENILLGDSDLKPEDVLRGSFTV